MGWSFNLRVDDRGLVGRGAALTRPKRHLQHSAGEDPAQDQGADGGDYGFGSRFGAFIKGPEREHFQAGVAR